MHEINKAIEWLRETQEENKEAKDRVVLMAVRYGASEKAINNDFRCALMYLEGYKDGWRNRREPHP